MLFAVFSSTGPINVLWSYLALLALIGVVILLLGLFGMLLGRMSSSSSKGHSTVGNALLRMEATFLPGREHVVEAIERDEADQDDQGDPPEPGKT